MEIEAVASALNVVNSYAPSSTGSVAQTVSVKMLDKTMEMSESMNSELIRLMENSVTPHIGGNIDIRI